MPVRFVEATNELYPATSQKVEHSVLNPIGSILDCGILPCLVRESVTLRWIEHADDQEDALVQQFDRVTPASEIVRITSTYAAIVRGGSYLWVGLGHRADRSHFLFRQQECSAEPTAGPLDLHAV
jgi:hypothetical protein